MPSPRFRPWLATVALAATALAQQASTEALRAHPVLGGRLDWWSFRPPAPAPLPSAGAADAMPIDRFAAAARAAQALPAPPPAPPEVLLRRLSLLLRGLPPTRAEQDAFARDPGPAAFAATVDAYLASPEFAITWARHWLDWLRYAESHGSEGDPPIPYAERYRDYVVRALQRDVPYDQLVREALAGDLLPAPRLDAVAGRNESAIGPAHLRMVFHGYAPTDALAERIRFTDDQIDVVSKAFLGLTVSCARCHDHKFDPISQRDYTALQGVFFSCVPAVVDARAERVARGAQADPAARFQPLQRAARTALARAWRAAADTLAQRLAAPDAELQAAITAARDPKALLHPFAVPPGERDRALATWRTLASVPAARVAWDLTRAEDLRRWHRAGPGLQQVAPAGASLPIAADGTLRRVLPSSATSLQRSLRNRGVLLSPRVALESPTVLWVHAAGDGGAVIRPVVQDYPRDGSVFPVTRLEGGDWRWLRFDLDYWTGDAIRIEATTAADQPVLARTDALESWFAVREVLLLPRDAAPPTTPPLFAPAVLDALGQADPADPHALATAYAEALRRAADAWAADAHMGGNTTDAQAHLLDALLGLRLIPARSDEPAGLELGRALAAEPLPERVPGVLETEPRDAPLLLRGDPHQPGEREPRRDLELFGGTPCAADASGRLQLAEAWTRPDHPLVARVAVNRVWQLLFGRGLVATPENFGHLGAAPTDPRLLDWLALDFVAHGWSLRHLIRTIVLSAAWRSQAPSAATPRTDAPETAWFAGFAVRRLPAEAVRDALLAVAGQIDPPIGGFPAANDLPRRSLYLRQPRNAPDPFLAAFDAPVAAGCTAQRAITNVPAQALTLLNDPFVWRCAEQWAASLAADPACATPAARIDAMHRAAFGRTPTEGEAARALAFLQQREQALATAQRQQQQAERELASLDTARLAAARELAASLARTAPTLPEPVYAARFARPQLSPEDPREPTELSAPTPLRLDGPATRTTRPLARDLRGKTLIAVVRLDDLTQRGGAPIAVQTRDGERFDAIVFGEREPGHWQAGSDGFARTQSFGGPPETEAARRPVHIAITYAEDGTVTCYRDGAPYGKPYRASTIAFAAAASAVELGVRHAPADGAASVPADRWLHGLLFGAWAYDRAWTAAEVQWHALTRAGIAAPELRAQAAPALAARLADLDQALQRAVAASGATPPRPDAAWVDLAHALFNQKEFVWFR